MENKSIKNTKRSCNDKYIGLSGTSSTRVTSSLRKAEGSDHTKKSLIGSHAILVDQHGVLALRNIYLEITRMKGIFLKIYLFKRNNPKKLQDQPSKACKLRYKYIGIKNIIHMCVNIYYI